MIKEKNISSRVK